MPHSNATNRISGVAGLRFPRHPLSLAEADSQKNFILLREEIPPGACHRQARRPRFPEDWKATQHAVPSRGLMCVHTQDRLCLLAAEMGRCDRSATNRRLRHPLQPRRSGSRQDQRCGTVPILPQKTTNDAASGGWDTRTQVATSHSWKADTNGPKTWLRCNSALETIVAHSMLHRSLGLCVVIGQTIIPSSLLNVSRARHCCSRGQEGERGGLGGDAG